MPEAYQLPIFRPGPLARRSVDDGGEGRRIQRIAPFWEAVWLLILFVIAMLVFVSRRSIFAGFSLLALEIAVLATAHLLFAYGQLWLPSVVPAMMLLPAGYLASLAFRPRKGIRPGRTGM